MSTPFLLRILNTRIDVSLEWFVCNNGNARVLILALALFCTSVGTTLSSPKSSNRISCFNISLFAYIHMSSFDVLLLFLTSYVKILRLQSFIAACYLQYSLLLCTLF